MDSYSKWLEVFSMNSMTAGKTIERLRSLFARYGLPDILVSDNGGQSTSEEFSKFLMKNVYDTVKYHLIMLLQMGRLNSMCKR